MVPTIVFKTPTTIKRQTVLSTILKGFFIMSNAASPKSAYYQVRDFTLLFLR